MKRLFFLCLFFCLLQAEPSIVLVHLGKDLPTYLPITIDQIRLFNPKCPVYLLANQEAIDKNLQKFKPQNVEFVSCESLPKSAQHQTFSKDSTLDKNFRNGFWTFTTERFFYLAAFIKDRNLQDVFHMENDIMLYADLNELLPTFQANYPNMIAATFDNDKRCIPGFLYISKSLPLEHLVAYIARAASKGGNDMEFLAGFKNRYHKKWIDCLPILMPEYAAHNELVSAQGHRGINPGDYFRNAQQFSSIFDAAAIGQYLGGIDPLHKQDTIGFINESCVFNPSKWTFEWQLDEQNRSIPFAIYQGHKWKINNLHIHSKNLAAFSSHCKQLSPKGESFIVR